MITQENIEIHLTNKREAFDAMRAYHESEISHKGHAISVLQSVLQATILVYGGLFGLMLKDGISITIIQFSGICCLLIITIASRRIALSTQEKIRQDNIQYCLHYFEYRKERELLGLELDLLNNNFVSKAESININTRKDDSPKTIREKCEEQSLNTKNCFILQIIKDLTGFNISKQKNTSGHIFTQDILMNLVRVNFLVSIIGTIGLYLLGVK